MDYAGNQEETIAVWDYDLEGNLQNGDLKIQTNTDAVDNALKCWFRTEKGEILNYPERGGALSDTIFKNFGEFTKLKAMFDFRSELDNYFFPKVRVVSLDFDMDKNKREWGIKLKYYIEEFEVTKLTTLPLERLKLKPSYLEPEEEIAYTGTSLENFVKIYLWELRNISLKWNGNYWQWDRFIFTELDESDDNFNLIQDMINSNKDY